MVNVIDCRENDIGAVYVYNDSSVLLKTDYYDGGSKSVIVKDGLSAKLMCNLLSDFDQTISDILYLELTKDLKRVEAFYNNESLVKHDPELYNIIQHSLSTINQVLNSDYTDWFDQILDKLFMISKAFKESY